MTPIKTPVSLISPIEQEFGSTFPDVSSQFVLDWVASQTDEQLSLVPSPVISQSRWNPRRIDPIVERTKSNWCCVRLFWQIFLL
jgi:hypothetical protein